MTPQQLKALILAQPNGSAIRTAYDRGDAECAAALNAKTIAAYIPRRHLLSVLLEHNFMPVVRRVIDSEKLPNGDPAPFATVYTFCVNVQTVIDNQADDLRTPIDARLDAGCELFASLDGVTAAQLKAMLIAKAGKVSVFEQASELDAVVTSEEVAAARAA